MEKKFIKISTIKRRIDNILCAYDEQLSNSSAHETSAGSSSSCINNNTTTSSENGEKEKSTVSYQTIDIEPILAMIEKRSESQLTAATSRSKRRSGALKRPSTSQSGIPKKKIQTEDDSPLAASRKPYTRSSARQQNQKKPVTMTNVPSIVIESDTDPDENNSAKSEAVKTDWTRNPIEKYSNKFIHIHWPIQ